jgi:two-component system OmpR family sensor kinase
VLRRGSTAVDLGGGTAIDRPLRTGSLRRRVVLCVVAILLLVMVILALVVNLLLGNRLRSDLRQRLTERANYASVLSTRGGLEAQQLADALTGQGITASVRTDGEVVVGRDSQRPPDAAGGRPGQRPAQSAPSGTVTITRRGPELIAEIQGTTSSLLLVTSEVEINRTLTTLHHVELGAGAVMLLISAGISVAVMHVATRPLARMASLAHGIRRGARGRRLHPTHPHTDLGRTAAAVDGMIDALETAEANAQSAEMRMRQFLADASHDLRTPLAGIVASAESLLRADPSRVQRESQLVDLIREGRRAARLVDDLLLMTRLDESDPSAALRHELIDLAALAASVVAVAAVARQSRIITLDAPSRVPLVGDPDRLTQVVTNLLDNARAATSVGEQIIVRVHTIGAEAVLDVVDDGQGVGAADRDRIFDRFVRLDNARVGDGYGGSGLGLPIARAIARGHEGDLVCLPATRGAHFQLRLPGTPAIVTAELVSA